MSAPFIIVQQLRWCVMLFCWQHGSVVVRYACQRHGGTDPPRPVRRRLDRCPGKWTQHTLSGCASDGVFQLAPCRGGVVSNMMVEAMTDGTCSHGLWFTSQGVPAYCGRCRSIVQRRKRVRTFGCQVVSCVLITTLYIRREQRWRVFLLLLSDCA